MRSAPAIVAGALGGVRSADLLVLLLGRDGGEQPVPVAVHADLRLRAVQVAQHEEGELATLAGKDVKIPISADLSGLTSQISNSLSSSMGGLGNYAGLLGGMGLAGGAVLGGAALGYTAYNQAASWQERGTSISRTTGLEGEDLERFKNDLQ